MTRNDILTITIKQALAIKNAIDVLVCAVVSAIFKATYISDSKSPHEIVKQRARDDIGSMTDERIQKIKSAVESADHISAEKKDELLDILAKLKPAIAEVAQTHEADAERISQFVEASAHEVATKKERPESIERVLHKLKQTVEKFEASHPQLTAFVTEYSAVLSGLGI